MWFLQIDGFGNAFFMDDANIPSLLAMPYYNFTSATDPLYLNTRSAVLSSANMWYLNGTAGAGVGGPHDGWPNIWPMSIIMQGWTAQSDDEILQVLDTLLNSTACTGLMHESFNVVRAPSRCTCVHSRYSAELCPHSFPLDVQNDVTSFTRPWFAWVNSLFGSFILKLANEKPYLIFN